MEDYSKYLSYDNGYGILLGNDDKEVLDKYNIKYEGLSDLKVLINYITDYLDNDTDEELEMVLTRLEERYYYNYVNK